MGQERREQPVHTMASAFVAGRQLLAIAMPATRWICVIVFVLAGAGCRPNGNTPETQPSGASKTAPVAAAPLAMPPEHGVQPEAPAPADTNSSPAPLPVPPPSPTTFVFPDEAAGSHLFQPEVLLSVQHEATGKLHVDETFPNIDVQSLSGQPLQLDSQMGPTLTIVLFWNEQQPMSREAVHYAQAVLKPRFEPAGISIVPIHVGGTSESIAAALKDLHVDLPCWSDPDGSAFAQAAREHLPRIYVLRPDRSIAWFDQEFSRSTRRELTNAILFTLKQAAK